MYFAQLLKNSGMPLNVLLFLRPKCSFAFYYFLFFNYFICGRYHTLIYIFHKLFDTAHKFYLTKNMYAY